METPAWRALLPTAQAAYVWIKLEWKGPYRNNNGMISISTRQLAEKMGISANTASKALRDLQAKGFLVVRRAAHIGVTGKGRSHQFEVTELPVPGETVGQKLYRSWKPDHGFQIVEPVSSRKNPVTKNATKLSQKTLRSQALRLENCDVKH